MTAIYDRCVFGMKTLNISQIGSGYDGKNHYSHTGYELDLSGEDSGRDVWRNMMPDTFWLCAGRWGNATSGNTRFFWPVDANGKAKKILLADGTTDTITLALTHANEDYPVGKRYGFQEIMYREGTSGAAQGNHIHLEVCRGCVCRKIENAKGYYNLPGIMDARKVFFILDGYTTVRNTQGLEFKHCDRVRYIPDEEKGGEDVIIFQPKKASANIRKALEFKDGRNVAAIVATIPAGRTAEVTHFTQRFEEDGYEWVQVKYQTEGGKEVTGFCQLDTRAYLLKKK